MVSASVGRTRRGSVRAGSAGHRRDACGTGSKKARGRGEGLVSGCVLSASTGETPVPLGAPVPRGARAGRACRRGAILPMAAALMVVVCGFAAFAVDVGYIYVAQTEMRSAADAAAMAACLELADDDRLSAYWSPGSTWSAARDVGVDMVVRNEVLNQALVLDRNDTNDPAGDIVIGQWVDGTGQMSYTDPSLYDAVWVRVRQNATRNGPIPLFFARVIGVDDTPIEVEAAALFEPYSVVGFQVDADGPNSELLPFALDQETWTSVLQNGGPDNWSYNPDTGAVALGGDGIPEMSLYPSGPQELPPGNRGTVDIGAPNNSTAEIARQILHGVNAADLSYFGGELRLGPDGTLILNGDTGISAGMKDELESIRGQPRVIPIFSHVEGPGNNAMYTVVGFVGIRVLDVRLVGKNKYVTIQPAYVLDRTAITDPDAATSSYFVYPGVRLVR